MEDAADRGGGRHLAIGCNHDDSAWVHDHLADPFRLRVATEEDLDWVVERHATLYRQEQNWDERFAAIPAQVVADFRTRRDTDGERGFLAEQDGQRLGCAFVMRDESAVASAKLRLLLVEPHARRRGIGEGLVAACIQFARQAGYRSLSLWTESVLTDARRLYERKGFRLVRTRRHRSFGAEMNAEIWELTW
mgnify:CR=1 FL=1